MLHSAFLLLFMLVAAPLASFIPLSALAGVLAVVAWNMVETDAFKALLRSSRGDALVLLVTAGLVIFRDLTEGIVVGSLIGAILFIDRMSRAAAVVTDVPILPDDLPDEANGARGDYDPGLASDRDVVIYRISGAFFFGSAASVGAVLDRIADQRKSFILDCSAVPFLDSTAANVIEGAVRKAEKAGIRVLIAGASPAVRRMLVTHGVKPPHVRYKASIRSALAHLRRASEQADAAEG